MTKMSVSKKNANISKKWGGNGHTKKKRAKNAKNEPERIEKMCKKCTSKMHIFQQKKSDSAEKMPKNAAQKMCKNRCAFPLCHNLKQNMETRMQSVLKNKWGLKAQLQDIGFRLHQIIQKSVL